MNRQLPCRGKLSKRALSPSSSWPLVCNDTGEVLPTVHTTRPTLWPTPHFSRTPFTNQALKGHLSRRPPRWATCPRRGCVSEFWVKHVTKSNQVWLLGQVFEKKLWALHSFFPLVGQSEDVLRAHHHYPAGRHEAREWYRTTRRGTDMRPAGKYFQSIQSIHWENTI